MLIVSTSPWHPQIVVPVRQTLSNSPSPEGFDGEGRELRHTGAVDGNHAFGCTRAVHPRGTPGHPGVIPVRALRGDTARNFETTRISHERRKRSTRTGPRCSTRNRTHEAPQNTRRGGRFHATTASRRESVVACPSGEQPPLFSPAAARSTGLLPPNPLPATADPRPCHRTSPRRPVAVGR